MDLLWGLQPFVAVNGIKGFLPPLRREKKMSYVKMPEEERVVIQAKWLLGGGSDGGQRVLVQHMLS